MLRDFLPPPSKSHAAPAATVKSESFPWLKRICIPSQNLCCLPWSLLIKQLCCLPDPSMLSSLSSSESESCADTSCWRSARGSGLTLAVGSLRHHCATSKTLDLPSSPIPACATDYHSRNHPRVAIKGKLGIIAANRPNTQNPRNCYHPTPVPPCRHLHFRLLHCPAPTFLCTRLCCVLSSEELEPAFPHNPEDRNQCSPFAEGGRHFRISQQTIHTF